MLNGLLKPAWQSKSTEKRRLAIVKMSSEKADNQNIFEQLALSDPSQTVRQICIEKITNPATLFAVYLDQNDQTTKQTAKLTLCKQISLENENDVEPLKRVLANVRGTHTVDELQEYCELLAQNAPFKELREELITGFSDIQKASIIAGTRYADTRSFIAENLANVDALERARKELKGKDKRAEKIIRTSLDKVRQEQKLREATAQEAKTLCEQLEFIAEHPQWRSEFKPKFRAYLSKWQSLERTPPSDYAMRFEAAKKLAKGKVDNQVENEQRQQKQEQVAKNLNRYSSTLASLDLAELSQERLSINTVLGEALAVWLESNATESASANVSDQFITCQQALSRLASLLESVEYEDYKAASAQLKQLSWPKALPELNALPAINNFLEEQKRNVAIAQKDYKKNLDALHKRINRLLGTSNKGDLKKARHELSATTKAASHYDGRDGKLLAERIASATDLVAKMNDWQSFAIEPKLVELCDAMEKLISSEAKPDKKAKLISQLQNQWKELGHADVSDHYWDRFKLAADKAYEPCAVFFEERKAIQKANLARREPLISKVEAIYKETDWDNSPDWKQIDRDLRTISNDWRAIKNVDPNAGKKQWQKFSAAKQLVLDKFDVIYDANLKQKETLIRQVETLQNSEVDESAIEKLQLFQTRWKQVGITRRKQDQAAWKRFKAACDAVFEKVQNARSEAREQQDLEITSYRNIINKINDLADHSKQLCSSEPKFEQLCTDFAELPQLPKELPEKLVNRIHADFQRSRENYSRARDRIITQNRDRVFAQLRTKAELCGEIEKALYENDQTKASEAESKMQSICIEDAQLEKRFKTRLDAISAPLRETANNERRLMCIRLEILLNKESPEQDKPLRMQMQLQRMSDKGLGSTQSNLERQIEQFKIAWLCDAGAEPKIQAKLEPRFWALIGHARRAQT